MLTNDGDIVNRMMRSSNGHEKEYEVTVNRPVTREFLKAMSGRRMAGRTAGKNQAMQAHKDIL